MNKIIVHCVGILSLLYLLNIGVGIIEIIPDNFPIIGNLDEATATVLFLNYLRFLGIDLSRFFERKDKLVRKDKT